MALQSKAATTISGKAKIPFWVRLKAWWEGYDLALRQKQLLAAEMGDLSQGAARNEQEARVSKRLEVMQ